MEGVHHGWLGMASSPEIRNAGVKLRVRQLVVVVPVHNEAGCLSRCLASVRRAATQVDVPVRTMVVLDSCTDGSEASIGSNVTSIAVHERNVGAARAAGFAWAGSANSGETWFVSTDADCVVPPWWLRRHLAHAETGAGAVCGTVAVRNWGGLNEVVRTRYESSYVSRDGHRHIHGANLGVRASDYWAVGGFHSLHTGEDVDLVRRLTSRGIRITWTGNMPVVTSARLQGRAPDGFAAHLRSLQRRAHECGELTTDPAVRR